MSLALVQARRHLDSTVQVSGVWKSIWSRGQPCPVGGENAHGCHGSLPVYSLLESSDPLSAQWGALRGGLLQAACLLPPGWLPGVLTDGQECGVFPPALSTAVTRTREPPAALTGLQERCFPPSFFQLEGCC